MLSSAVIIPEQPSTQPDLSSSPTLKRSRSPQSPDSNKKPRIDTEQASRSYANGSPSQISAVSPLRRKSSLLSGTEERKRGQRLFGGLLGTLSQTSSKPAHRKRDEVEKRQQERLKRDTAEREEVKRLKKEELSLIRREEQKAWDSQSTKIRHTNMRHMANFLRTKTEPVLYYKPWELRPEEEETIRRHRDEVENTINAESGMSRSNDRVDSMKEAIDDPTPQDDENPESAQRISKSETDQMKDETPQESRNGQVNGEHMEEKPPDATENSRVEDTRDIEMSIEEKSKEDDHGGEELVEGHEDDVIY